MSNAIGTAVENKAEAALVHVFAGEIGGVSANVCDARELHAYLQNGDKFAGWIKARIEKYDFKENRDFHSFSVKAEKPRGGRPSTEYHLSLRMAQELSMVEDNEQGRSARHYFIDMERRALERSSAESGPDSSDSQKFVTLHYLRFSLRLVVESGKVWFSAASLASIFGLHSSDRIYRTLPEWQTYRVQRGRQSLVFVDYDAMLFAIGRTPIEQSCAFRSWLDDSLPAVLNASRQQPKSTKQKALPNGLSLDQQAGLKALVSARMAALPVNRQAGAARKCWGALSRKFGCSYKEIHPEQYVEACNLIGRLPLEGELLEEEVQAPSAALNINYPTHWLLEQNPECFRLAKQSEPDLFVTATDMSMYRKSAIDEVLVDLERAGYCISAARHEYEALRHYLRIMEQSNRMMAANISNAMQLFEDERRTGKRFIGALAAA